MPTALKYICDLAPYDPGVLIETAIREHGIAPDQIVMLASNESSLGPSPKALLELQGANRDIHRYPDQFGLVQALANHFDVSTETILLGNGSNDVLDIIARTYLAEGDEAISSQYAFSVYRIAVQSTGAKNVITPAKNYGHDLEAMLAAVTAKTKIIWIANPNNPTGTFMPYGEVKKFLEQVPKEVVVVLDEAYYEYLDPSERVNSIAWLADHPNLVLVRTFSKIYGLAGLRVGYGITSPEIADPLNRVRQPFNVNGLGIIGAVAALDDQEFVVRAYQQNKAGLKQLKDGFDSLGLQYLPAYGNFVTVKVTRAQDLYESLLLSGIIVRPLTAYDMPEHLRVTVGTRTEHARLLAALEDLV